MNFLNDILPLKNKLFRTALRITQNRQEAEDIVQNTLIKVWDRRDELHEIKSPEAFAFTVCRNLSLDFLKQKSRDNLSLDDIAAIPLLTSDDPLQHLARQDNLSRIEEIINSLPEKQRTCMQLRDIEGLTYKEIAAVLSVSEEQVKVNIFRARKAVKERFSEEK